MKTSEMPDVVVPQEVLEAVRTIENWIIKNGFDKGAWAIGPVASRASLSLALEKLSNIRAIIQEIEYSFLR